MTFRKLTANDWEQYKTLRLEALQHDPDAYFATYDEVSRWSDHSFRSEISYLPDQIAGYFGIIDTNHLVAYAAYIPPYFSKQSHTIELANLYVMPTHRHQGVARTLLVQMRELLVERSMISEVYLHVVSTNTPAINLYTSLGFACVGQKKRSIQVGHEFLDECIYQWSIDRTQSDQRSP